MFNRIMQKLKHTGQKGLDILFQPADTALAKWIATIFLAILFVVGILHWGYFLNWFNNRFDLGDWHVIVDPILVFISNALHSGQLPMHGNSPLFVPDRFLGRPDRPLSPQILLLYFMNPATYVMINVWIFFAIGFIGLLLIRRRYQLCLAAFTVLFLLFNFSGPITAHLAVGHVEWVGYFLLPWFVMLVLRMLEGEKIGWSWVFGMAFTMLVINLQGVVYIFLWCMAFLLMLAIIQPHFWAPVLKAILASVLLSMVRIIPLAIQYYNSSGVTFIFGFLSISQMLDALVILHSPYILDTPSSQLGSWEVDFYLGLIGFLFVFYFGVIQNWLSQKSYRLLYFPMMVMAFFSLADDYRPIFNSHIPFMDSQRAPSRFILIPFVFLIVLASIQLQKWIKGRNYEGWMERVAMASGLVFIGVDLFEHSRAWRLATMSSKVLEKFTDVVVVPLVNRPDPAYVASIITGVALTMIAFILLVVFTLRERKMTLQNKELTK
jgi:hypothetical protein